MNYSFHPEAEEEFIEAINYYEEKESGLGYDFAIEVYLTIERTIAFPKAWPIIEDDIRRSLVQRFPYGILYSEDKEKIYIVAVMHLHREPEYWKYRI
ncbi:type II toxin-antitoxin system RelE/ParE family toxin [Candidatus Desantisbacteria bacterium]|nr:type II toxin-antitoxin system RelE/ParE family toxin [Candidatus Desantisbacteria bacterium]